MSCGKRPLVKKWDKVRNIRVIKPSRYEQNEVSVKQHWKKVLKDLEDSYKDDQFWESQCNTVRHLVGPIIFQHIAKIFNLPPEEIKYNPQPELESPVPSEEFYKIRSSSQIPQQSAYSMSNYDLSVEEEEVPEEESELWSVSSVAESQDLKRSKSTVKSKSLFSSSKSIPQLKSFSKFAMSRTLQTTFPGRAMSGIVKSDSTVDESVSSGDDVFVHVQSMAKGVSHTRAIKNPHFEMLYCSKSETDMIKWKSKYKQKTFEVSASDEFSNKAEIMTKKISSEFYDWWVGLGNIEFKSEIKRPEDIEALFQVWFDEHASRGLKLEPKILPCVLPTIAKYAGVPRASCPRVLKRQIADDIHAETSPAHMKAFNTCLPQKMKHIPPKNNTDTLWHGVKIPGDLKSMACVWEDIGHLTSTKAFQKWLKQRPYLPMPPVLAALDIAGDTKQPFVVPSDYVVRSDKSSISEMQELALPVSRFSLELKEVLSKLLNK